MPGQKSQTGSTHVVIVVILLIALVGVLGWSFWTNFVSTDSNTNANNASSANSDTPDKDSKATLKKACLTSEAMCFDYPVGWSVDLATRTSEGIPYVMDNVTLKSPDGFTLFSQTGIDGIGGTCEPNETGDVIVVESVRLAINGYGFGERASYDARNLYAVRTVHANKANTEFTPDVFLTTDLDLTSKGVKPGCDVGYGSLFSTKNVVNEWNGERYPTLMSFGSFNPTGPFSQISPTLADAKNRLDSDTYKAAFKILTSVRYE